MRPPKRIAIGTPMTSGICQLTMKTPDITAHNVMPVPSERSMPAVMITKVAPIARVPMTTVENSIEVTFEKVRKFELANEKKTKMTISPANARNC